MASQFRGGRGRGGNLDFQNFTLIVVKLTEVAMKYTAIFYAYRCFEGIYSRLSISVFSVNSFGRRNQAEPNK